MSYVVQGTALQRGAPRLLHPIELAVRLRKGHVDTYYRDWNGRHRNRSHRSDDCALRRPLSISHLHRWGDCVREAPQEPGTAFCGPVCCKGGGHESARYRALARRPLARYRGGARTGRTAATAVSWGRRQTIRPPQSDELATDDNPLPKPRDGAGDAASVTAGSHANHGFPAFAAIVRLVAAAPPVVISAAPLRMARRDITLSR